MVYGPNDAACYHEAPPGTKAARRLEADRGECAIQRPRVVRFADRAGRLMVGYEGDVVVLAADPRDDPTAFAKVEITIRRGQVVYSRNR